ncbi:MAG: hypothetical protein JWQ82_1023 [Tardiphaga sp.]|nr:hypothetical protein [Tardiphaga sp.]
MSEPDTAFDVLATPFDESFGVVRAAYGAIRSRNVSDGGAPHAPLSMIAATRREC